MSSGVKKAHVKLMLISSFLAGIIATFGFQALLAPAPDLAIWKNSTASYPQITAAQVASTNSSSSIKPWGELEYQILQLAPDEIPISKYSTPKQAQWLFENLTQTQVAEIFDSCNLIEPLKSQLINPANWKQYGNGCVVTFPEDLLVHLAQADGQRIYPILARSVANVRQRNPYRFPLDGFDARFSHANLTPEHLAMVRNVTWTNNNWLCLSMVDPFYRVFSTNEFASFIQALQTTPTMTMRLHVRPDSDMDALLKYWGRGGRENATRPLLEALSRRADGGTVNVSYFLPTFARVRLYVYPDPQADPIETREDCFFTAMNFLRSPADTNFFDFRYTGKVLQHEYEVVKGDLEFGDVIILAHPNGASFHACVYIADNVVFTKNGTGPTQPWVLMKIPDMMAVYAHQSPSITVAYRQKKLSSALSLLERGAQEGHSRR